MDARSRHHRDRHARPSLPMDPDDDGIATPARTPSGWSGNTVLVGAAGLQGQAGESALRLVAPFTSVSRYEVRFTTESARGGLIIVAISLEHEG